jgi:hypothetical protein
MTFDIFIKKPMQEGELLEQITRHLQANYSAFQDQYYFIKLEVASEQLVQIAWIKIFTDMYDFGDFYCDTVNERACVLIKFEEGFYELLIQGFHTCDRFKIYPDRISGSDPIVITWNREEKRMPSRELLEHGFESLAGALLTVKTNKAM